MSFENGWAAINLEMVDRIPRIEFDAERHWDLVKVVTGIDVNFESSEDLQKKASLAFMQAWNYDLQLLPLITAEELGKIQTSMGHAEYLDGGTDFNEHIECPFKEPEDVFNFDPWEAYGKKDKNELIDRFNKHYKSLCEYNPDVVNTTGTYITLFSGFIAIFGWDMFLLAGGIDPEKLGEVANRYASWMQQYYDALAESDVQLIYSHDDIVWTSGAVFHPEWYRKYIFPNLKKYYEPVIESGKKVLFIADGDYTEFIDDVVATNAHGFFMEPLTDLKYVVEHYGQSHIIVGNVDTRTLLRGSKEDIYNEVNRCLSLGKNCPGYFLAVSNMIPANTPIESALYYNEVYEKLCKR